MGESRESVVVIGGGVAGLGIAYELMERAERRPGGVRLLCLEAAERPGGNIRTERADGFLFEWGPNGFLDNAPATLTLARRLSLEESLMRAQEAAAARFIYRRGRLRRVPMSPLAFLRSGVIGPLAKLRLLAEPLSPRRKGDDDESVFDFAARRIGSEAAAILVDAMVSGVYAGDSRRLSLAATFPKMRRMEDEHGSLFRAMLALRRARREEGGAAAGGPAGPGGTLTSFANGLEELTDALAKALGARLKLGCRVDAVSDLGDRGYRVHLEEGAPLDVDAVVLACPSWSAARLVHAMDPELASLMDAIPSAPLAVVHFGYTDSAVGDQPEGFGFLVPRGQGPRILGTLWASQIFQGRAPRGRRLMTSMVGGAHDPEVAEMEDREIVAIVRRDLHEIMGIEVAPYLIRVFRHPRGIPQYTLGHLDRLGQIERRLERHAGLWVAGNSYRGISVNACVEEAPAIAEQVLDFVPGSSRAAEL